MPLDLRIRDCQLEAWGREFLQVGGRDALRMDFEQYVRERLQGWGPIEPTEIAERMKVSYICN
jgi:hypothetical protein